MQGINLAANAYLRWALGDGYQARLLGLASPPKEGTRLSLDFATLLGPLFFNWLNQLLLPIMLYKMVRASSQQQFSSSAALTHICWCPSDAHSPSCQRFFRACFLCSQVYDKERR